MSKQLPIKGPASKLFAEGKYKELSEYPLNEIQKWSPAQQCFYIGALNFVGKEQEAEKIQKILELKSKWTEAERVFSRFFFIVSKTRASQYSEAKHLLLKNYQWYRKNKKKEHPYSSYVLQGFGFFRFQSAKFKQALKWAEWAWMNAKKNDDDIAQILASDLKGHSCIQVRSYAEGVSYLNAAQKICQKTKNYALYHSLEVSKLCYQAQFNHRPDLSEKKIIAAINNELFPEVPHKTANKLKKAIQDTYSLANLYLELARLQTLQGHIRKAFETLEKAYPYINRKEYRRQKATYFQRKAYLYFLQSQYCPEVEQNTLYKMAKECIQNGLELLVLPQDSLLQLQMIGLSYRIAILNAPLSTQTKLKHEMIQLTLKTQSSIGMRILRRLDLNEKKVAFRQDDRLGNVIDQWLIIHEKKEQNSFSCAQYLNKEKIGSFFYQSFHWRGTKIIIGLIPKKALIFGDQSVWGNIMIPKYNLTPLLITFLMLLCEDAQSKTQIIQKLYGFSYHPLRHDPMLYALVFRLRKALGLASHLLISNDHHYKLNESVELLEVKFKPRSILETNETNKALSSLIKNSSPDQHQLETHFRHSSTPLNHRQILTLEKLNEHQESGFISVSEYQNRFKISKVQATRDLSQLFKLGFVIRVGKARATQYCLKKGLTKL